MEDTREITIGCFPVSRISRPGHLMIPLGSGLLWEIHMDKHDLDYVGIGDIVKIKLEFVKRQKSLGPGEA